MLRVTLRNGIVRRFPYPAEISQSWRWWIVSSAGELIAVFRSREVVSVEVDDN